MPKSYFRYKHMDRRGSSCPGVVAAQSSSAQRGLVVSAPPRKVSFEDSRNDSNPSICSDDTVPTKNNKKTPTSETIEGEKERRQPIRRKRSVLARPITSLSLVDLAKSVAHDGVVSPTTSGQSDVDKTEERNSKRVCSFDLSPRSVVSTPAFSEGNKQNLSSFLPSSEEESKSIKTSPWGHFIDMAPDEENCINSPISAYPGYDSKVKLNRRGISRRPCKESLCRTRRRPSPYGEYKSYTIKEASNSPTLSFVGLRTDSKSCKFRLSPRSKDRNHRSADELIVDFSELQVQPVQQRTI